MHEPRGAQMGWKPIVAGIDDSPEGAGAAIEGARLARMARTTCQLVHAVRDPWADVLGGESPKDIEERNRRVLEWARGRMREVHAGAVEPDLLARLIVRYGPTPIVLDQVADELDAEMVVLGGKHHSGVGRWVAGNGAHYLVRTVNRPILITGPATDEDHLVRRVLAAVDLSHATLPTLRAAARLAAAVGAKLRVLHVFEPLPAIPQVTLASEEELMARAESELAKICGREVSVPETEWLVRRGRSARTIARSAAEWEADVVVVGTHGRGWVDRLLLGSVTSQLLGELPAAVLVVPTPAPAGPGGVRQTSGRAENARSTHGAIL